MAIRIGKLGIIKGGICEKKFKQRAARERGAYFAWNWLLENKCVQNKHGWLIIKKLPNKIFNVKYVISLHLVEQEVGWWRFMSDVAKQLYNTKRHFRLKWMNLWIRDIASFEFGLGTTDGSIPNPHDLEIFDQLESKSKHVFGYCKPHRPELYKQWEKYGN